MFPQKRGLSDTFSSYGHGRWSCERFHNNEMVHIFPTQCYNLIAAKEPPELNQILNIS